MSDKNRILIVGGAGYIGSHVNKMLSKCGYETVVFDNLVYGHKEAVKWGTLVTGDLGDKIALEQLFQTYRFDCVFHFAAYAYVGESVTNPSKYYNNNVANTLQLLDVMLKYGVRRFVFSSSCATYGVPERIPVTEDMPQRPINPYGSSKLMIERILEDYHNAYGLNYCALRYFNAAGADPDGEIGESHNPEPHLIPLVLAAAAKDRPCVKVFGTDYETKDGSCVRDYIHVTDLADAHLRAMDYLIAGNESTCVNLGNGTGYSVLEIIKAAKNVCGQDFSVECEGRRPGDPAILIGSSAKARRILGWSPSYTRVEDILGHAWYWYNHKLY